MRAKPFTLLLASAGLLLGSALSAPAQTSPQTEANPSISPPSEAWRERAMRTRAEAPDEAPVRGRIQDPEDRANRAGADESVGTGDLGKDRGDGDEGKK